MTLARLLPPLLAALALAGSLPAADVDLYGDPLPEGAVARMGTMRLRHGRALTALSPDGKVIATGSGFLRLWDASTGKLLRQIQSDWVGYLKFSPDGKWLAFQNNGAICLIDPSTGKLVRRIATKDEVLAVSPDARFLITWERSDTGDIVAFDVWDATSGASIGRLKVDEIFYLSPSFTPDSRTIVIQSSDKKLNRWDVATGVRRKTITLPVGTFSPDTRMVAVAERGQAVQLWDTETGKKRGELKGEKARRVAFTPDGKLLATGWYESDAATGTICFWDVATLKLIRLCSVPARVAETFQLSSDGGTLLSSGDGPVVYLFDGVTGRPLIQQPPAHEGEVTCLAFTRNGHTLISGSTDGTIRLWEPPTGKPGRVIDTHAPRGLDAVAILREGHAVLSCDVDQSLRVWDVATGKQPQAIAEPGFGPVRLAVAADGKRAATFSQTWVPGRAGPAEYLLHVWDLATGKALLRRAVNTANAHSEVRLFSPDLNAYLTYAGNELTTGPSIPLAKTPLGATAAVLKDVATGRPLLALPLPDFRRYPEAFSPDGRTLVTGTFRIRGGTTQENNEGYTLHFWELASGQKRLTIACPERGYQHGFERPVAFSPDGRRLATVRWNGMIQLWDVATGKELLRHSTYDAMPRSLAFAPDGKSLAVGYADSTILLRDLTIKGATPNQPPVNVEPHNLDSWWADLAADAPKAHAAIWKLIAVPEPAVELFRSRLTPAAKPPPEKLRGNLADLDHPQFTRREAASRELANMEERALPALEEALRANPSAEKRQRIEKLLAAPHVVRSPEALRGLRAVEVLEQIGTPEAKTVLETLARGAPEARLSQDAEASLKRMNQVGTLRNLK